MGLFDQQVTQSVSNPSTLAGQPVPQAQTLHRAMVLYAISSINLYLLESLEGPLVFGSMTFYGCDQTPTTPYGNGVSGGYMIPPGTRVFVNNTALVSMADASDSLLVFPIMAIDNEMPSADITWYPPWRTLTEDGFKKLTGRDLDKAIMGLQGIEPTDRLRGKPIDLTPGDWSMTNPADGGLFVGGDRVSMEASPVAGIDMFSTDSMIVFNKGLTYVEDQPWRRNASFTDIDGYAFDMETAADTTNQAMGYEDGDPSMFRPEVKDLAIPVETKATLTQKPPRWNRLRYNGRSLNGEILQRVVERRKDGTPQPGHSSFESADGHFERTSMHSMTLRRSLHMPYLEMTRELNSEDPQDDAEFEIEPDVTVSEEMEEYQKYASQYADLMYLLMKKKFVERYWAAQKARSKDWKALSMDDLARALGRAIDESLPALDEEEPCYEQKAVETSDPMIKEGKLTLALLESYIHLSPTGALSLSDGTGSEIRLEGGNIIISPAVDMRVQPGRDMSMTVPRTASLFAAGRIDIASDRDEIDIHADKNITVSAEGLTTIESRAQGNTVDASYEKRGQGGGLILRSASETHVLGNTVRVALQGPRDKSSTTIEDAATGVLVLDAGSRDIIVNAGSFNCSVRSDVLFNAGDEGACFVLQPEVMALAAKTMFVGVEGMSIGSSIETELIDIRKRSSEPSRFRQPAKGVSISVNGSVLLSEFLGARQMASEVVVSGQLSGMNGQKGESVFIPDGMKSEYRRVINTYQQVKSKSYEFTLSKEGLTYWLEGNFNPLWTADGVRRAGIYYPASDIYHQDKCFWVMSRWQRNMSAGAQWVPKDILDADDNPMLPFPGYGSWKENDSYTVTWNPEGVVATGPLADMWRVNCTIK